FSVHFVTRYRGTPCIRHIGKLLIRRQNCPARCRLVGWHASTDGLQVRVSLQFVRAQRTAVGGATKGFGYKHSVVPASHEAEWSGSVGWVDKRTSSQTIALNLEDVNLVCVFFGDHQEIALFVEAHFGRSGIRRAQ